MVLCGSWKTFQVNSRKSLDYLKETIGRNTDIKVALGGLLWKHFGNWRKTAICYEVEKHLAELCSSVL